MIYINFGAVIAAVLVGFIATVIYYLVLANVRAKYSKAKNNTEPGIKQALSEIARITVLTLVVTQLVGLTNSNTAVEALSLAAILWIGFPAVLLSGSVIHEKRPIQLALLYGGDWLLRLLIITTIVTLWR